MAQSTDPKTAYAKPSESTIPPTPQVGDSKTTPGANEKSSDAFQTSGDGAPQVVEEAPAPAKTSPSKPKNELKADPFEDTEAEDDEDTPAPGTRIAYRLRGQYGEWVPAEVVDQFGEQQLGRAPNAGNREVHLRAAVNRARHNSSSNVVLRLNVPYGTDEGCWSENLPKSNSKDVEAAKLNEAAVRAARLEVMAGRA